MEKQSRRQGRGDAKGLGEVMWEDGEIGIMDEWGKASKYRTFIGNDKDRIKNYMQKITQI